MPQSQQFSRFMNQFVPFLVQQQAEQSRAQMWLDKTLAEYADWDEKQRGLAKQSLMNSILELIAKSGYEQFQERPLGEEGYIDFLRRALPSGTMPAVTAAPDYQERLEQTLGAIVEATMAAQEGGKVSPDVVSVLARSIGHKYPTEIVSGIAKEKGEAAGREIRGRELAIEEQKLPISREEVRLRGEELKLETEGGKTKGQAEKDLKTLLEDRQALALKLSGVGTSLGLLTSQQIAGLMATIRKTNEQIAAAAEALGQPSPLPQPEHYGQMSQVIIEQLLQTGKAPNWYKLILDGFDPEWVMSKKAQVDSILGGGKPKEGDKMTEASRKLQALLDSLREEY